jgi:hypothetical protein
MLKENQVILEINNSHHENQLWSKKAKGTMISSKIQSMKYNYFKVIIKIIVCNMFIQIISFYFMKYFNYFKLLDYIPQEDTMKIQT